MIKAQKVFIAYGFVTVIIVALIRILNDSHIVAYIKYATVLTLLIYMLTAYRQGKASSAHVGAFVFVAVGDFFLVLVATFQHGIAMSEILGTFFFMAAYTCLIIYYKRNRLKVIFTYRVVGVIGLLLGSFMINLMTASIPLDIEMVIGLVLFDGVISYMVLLSIANMNNQAVPAKTSKALFVSAILMYVCDYCVAFNFLHPDMFYLNQLVKELTWLAYIPGWSLLAIASTASVYANQRN
jgi:hypothetical protein